MKIKLPINYKETHHSVRKIVREKYIELQDGKCYYCHRDINVPITEKEMKNRPINKNLFPKNFFKWPVHLHHDHNTGMTIGAVHSYCNAVLWQYHKE